MVSDLSLVDACHYVMHWQSLKFADGSSPKTPGSFFTRLFDAAVHADPINLQLIGIGFPAVQQSILFWRSTSGDVDEEFPKFVAALETDQ